MLSRRLSRTEEKVAAPPSLPDGVRFGRSNLSHVPARLDDDEHPYWTPATGPFLAVDMLAVARELRVDRSDRPEESVYQHVKAILLEVGSPYFL